MKRHGFSLIEVLIVIGLVGALGGMAIPSYRDFQIRSDLNLATEQVTQGLARAKLLSQSGQDDSGWGFYIPSGTLYKGDNYSERDTDFDEIYPMPSTITMDGIAEIYYSKIQGLPSSTGAITLTALNNDTRNVLINVVKESVAIVESDELVICHRPPGNPDNAQTITIGDNAWPTHRDSHGDSLGPCPGATSSSTASVSSQASSAASSAPAEIEDPLCSERFAIQSDGSITIAGDLNVQFTSLGGEFTYGENGPDIDVTVKYKDKSNGNNWKNMFNGDAINGSGGAQQTVALSQGDTLLAQFNAYYKVSKWLSYDRTIESNNSESAIQLLRNGDAAPLVTEEGQSSVSPLLSSVVTNGIVTIGAYDVLMMVDFDRPDCEESICTDEYCSACSDVGYDDGMVLIQFQEPSC